MSLSPRLLSLLRLTAAACLAACSSSSTSGGAAPSSMGTGGGGGSSPGAGGGSGAGKTKGGVEHHPMEAIAAHDSAGSVSRGAESKAKDDGADYEGAACDATDEDTGFCHDEQHIVFCHMGHWFELDCAEAAPGDFCGEDLGTHTVDCYGETPSPQPTPTKGGVEHHPADALAAHDVAGTVVLSFESKAKDDGADYESAACDATDEGEGFCHDEQHLIFCHGGHWFELDCAEAAPGDFCGEELSSHTVDCYAP